MTPSFLRLAFIAALLLPALPASAHEFWIDAERHAVAPGEPLVARLKVGQAFEGVEMSYLPQTFRRFDLVQGDVTGAVEGRMGDRPALNTPASGEGLAVAVHVTTDNVLSYDEFEKFRAFVEHKDAEWTLQAHAARGLPETGFREAYSRYAKALFAVGDGAGADREFGLETELVALANPYVDEIGGGVPVRLLYKGAPRADAQVEVFEMAADRSVEITLVRTDGDGVAIVPVRPGYRYMLDAVLLREPEGDIADRPGVVWESLWANLTFAVPD